MSAIVEIHAPAEVISALQHGRTYSTGWVRAHCPYCDPEGRRQRSLSAHPTRHFGRRRDRGGWKCHRCEAEKTVGRDNNQAYRMRYDPEAGKAEESRRREYARQIIERADVVRSGDPVDRYLRRRKLKPPTATWPSSLRRARLKHPHAKKEFQCMVGVVSDVAGMPVGIHRTFLTDDGHKAPVDPVKMTFGPIAGGAVRLGISSEAIIVAEGIESAFGAAMQITGVDAVPWAALSTGNMQRLNIPRDVKHVVIARDNDQPNRFGKRPGLEAALQLQAHIKALQLSQNRRIRVGIVAPPYGRSDYADFG
ncbi:MAG: toprim domain-containing protein [Gammaproteobacteria bacterium]|nr:toprim domain-containing protein [Gammaproteobacteria bacterium]